MRSFEPGFSILICSFNGGDTIEKCLNSLINLDWDKNFMDIILVDNNSTDQTSEIAKGILSSSGIEYQLLCETEPGKKYALALGIAAVNKEYFIICDDDNLLQSDYLQNAKRLMDPNPGIGLSAGLGIPIFPDGMEKPEWFDMVAHAYAVGPQASKNGAVPDSRGFLNGAGQVIRSSAWQKVIEAKEDPILSGRTGKALFAGEDAEMSLMLRYAGYQVYYTDELVFEHLIAKERLNIPYAEKLFYGFGLCEYIIDCYRKRLGVRQIPFRPLISTFRISLLHLLSKVTLSKKRQLMYSIHKHFARGQLDFMLGNWKNLKVIDTRVQELYNKINSLR